MAGRTFTDEILDDRMAEILRRKSPAERLEMAFSMWRFGRKLVGDSIRASHPDWTEEEVRSETARRMSGGTL